jgi:hypothetical protein
LALFVAYFLEGLEYIVIGTFLVAAVSAERGPVTSSAMWIVGGGFYCALGRGRAGLRRFCYPSRRGRSVSRRCSGPYPVRSGPR